MQQAVRDGGDRVGMGGVEARTSGGNSLSSCPTFPLKPDSGLSGPPSRGTDA
jgi:hypothetical protein